VIDWNQDIQNYPRVQQYSIGNEDIAALSKCNDPAVNLFSVCTLLSLLVIILGKHLLLQ